jgi:predicted NAD/FAD-binding protein
MEKDFQKTQVVIIGAGLAGLRAAIELQRNGIQYLIVEKDSWYGGRIQTIIKEGYLLDLGFQVLLDSYDELASAFNMATLGNQSFDSGALVVENDTKKTLFNPFKHPEKLFSTFFSYPGTFKDLLKMMAVAWKASKTNADFFKQKKTISTAKYLQNQNFSQAFINGFFNPFFGGVFLEPDLNIPANYFLWLVNKFRTGNACLPAEGMGAIGKLMAKDLGSILSQQTVTGINGNMVSLTNGTQIETDWIINATGKQDSIFNQNDNGEMDFLGTTTLYLKGKRQVAVSKSIVLIADP